MFCKQQYLYYDITVRVSKDWSKTTRLIKNETENVICFRYVHTTITVFCAPSAVSVMTRRNPKGGGGGYLYARRAGSITYPAHSAYILCLVYSRMPLKDAIIEPEYDRVW